MLIIKHLRVLFLCLLLSACGGGGSSSTDALSIAPTIVVSGDYWQIAPGSQIVYQVSPVTSQWDAASQSLTILTRGPVANLQTVQYSASYCGQQPFFVSTYNDGVLTAPAPIPAGLTHSLWDADYTSSTGIAYLGEGLNEFGTVTPGEAKLTMAPVAGEVIAESSRVTADCGSAAVTNAAYRWRYRTIEHLDTWRGYSDVWHTGLIEFNGGTVPAAVYNYWFARGIGMVGFVRGNPLDSATNIAPGYEYYAVPKI